MPKTKFNLSKTIIIVSGLPRSGTSLMMKMLEAGGIPPLTDHERAPDQDNLKGYYEYERVKKLPDGDTKWLKQARGKVIKVIAALLPHLPAKHEYRVIIMRREMEEILASQQKMLAHRGEEADKIADEDISILFEKHLDKVLAWGQKQKNLRYINIDYNELLQDPQPQIKKINLFLGESLNTQAMAEQIDPALYRNRS